MPGAINPIQEVQIGAVAYLFGIGNVTGQPLSLELGVNGTPGANVIGEMDSVDMSFTWKEKENTDTTGNVQNITQTNFKYESSIKLAPSGATRAQANANANSYLVAQFLVIANFSLSTVNGQWRVKPGTKIALKMDDNASIDIPCERYYNAGQNAALTGAPIAG